MKREVDVYLHDGTEPIGTLPAQAGWLAGMVVHFACDDRRRTVRTGGAFTVPRVSFRVEAVNWDMILRAFATTNPDDLDRIRQFRRKHDGGHRQPGQAIHGGPARGTHHGARGTQANNAWHSWATRAVDPAQGAGPSLTALQTAVRHLQQNNLFVPFWEDTPTRNPFRAWLHGSAQTRSYMSLARDFRLLEIGRPSSLPVDGVRHGEISGWRIWVCDIASETTDYRGSGGRPTLYSVVAAVPWQPGETMKAHAVSPHSGDGIHAYKDKADAAIHALNIADEHAGLAVAIGSIAMWGDVIEFERGWHAEFARVESITHVITNRKNRGGLVDRIAQAYGLVP